MNIELERIDDIIERKLQNPEFKFYWDKLAENPDADLDELEREYHRLYDNKEVSIDTSNLNLEKIQDILQNTPTSTFVDFVKEKKKAKKTRKNIWELENGEKVSTNNLLNIINPNLIKEEYKMSEDFFNYEPYKKALKYFDVYRYKDDSKGDVEFFDFAFNVEEALADIPDFSYVDFHIDYDDKNGYLYIIPTLTEYPVTVGYEDYAAEDILDANFLNNYSDGTDEFISDYNSVKNGIETEINRINTEILPEFAKTWNFKKLKKESLNESTSNKDIIPLYYGYIWVEGTDYGPRDRETGEGTKWFRGTSIDYTYEADRQEIEEELLKYLVNEDNPNIRYLDDNEAYEYISEHIEELVDKYYDDLLEYFRERAEKEAKEKFYETTDLDDFTNFMDEN